VVRRVRGYGALVVIYRSIWRASRGEPDALAEASASAEKVDD